MATIQDVLKQYSTATPPSEGLINELAGGAIEPIRSGIADIPRVLQKLSDASVNIAKVGWDYDVPRDEMFKKLAEAIEPKDFQDQPTLARKIGRTIGGVIVAVPKYAPLMAAGPATIPAFAAMEAATAWGQDAPPEEIAKAAVMGGAFGGLLKGTGQLARWPRAGALGGGAATIEAIAGQPQPEDLAITGLTMATLGLMGGRLPHGLKAKLNKLGYPDEAIKRLSIKEAREISKVNQKYTAPAPVIPEPVQASTQAPITNIEQVIQRANVGLEGSANDAVLLTKGFSDKSIAAMDYPTKVAIVNSDHTAKTINVDPISGKITTTGIVPEVLPTSPMATVSKPAALPGFGMSVEDMISDPITESKILNKVKEITPKYTSTDIIGEGAKLGGKVLIEDTSKLSPIKGKEWSGFNKLIFDQLKLKFTNITNGDARKVTKLLLNKGIKTPEEVSSFFEEMPLLPKGKSLYDSITTFEKKKALPPVSAEETATREEAKMAKLAAKQDIKEARKAGLPETVDLTPEPMIHTGQEIIDANNRQINYIVNAFKKEGKSNEEIEKDPYIKALHKDNASRKPDAVYKWPLELPKPGPAIEALKTNKPFTTLAIEEGKKFSVDDAQATFSAYMSEKDPFMKQLYREQVQGYLGSEKALTPAEMELELYGYRLADIGKREAKTASKKKITVKQLIEVTRKTSEEIPATKVKEQLVGKASVLWPNRRSDLVTLSETDLQKIIDKKILPDRASITPTGKLVETTTGDKALATALKISKEEGTTIREAVEGQSLRTQEGLLRSAANFMDLEWKLVKDLPANDKQAIIKSYLQHADDKIKTAQKVGDIEEKGSVEATKAYNKILSQKSETDPELAKLIAKHTKLNRQEMVAKRNYDNNVIDKADYDIIRNDRVEVLKQIEQRRNEIKKEGTKATAGDLEHLASFTKDDNGGIVVRKRKSDTIDEFYFITKAGKSPMPNDVGLNYAGKVVVDTSSGKPVKIEFPESLDIPQSQFFTEMFNDTIKGYYAGKGLGLYERGGVTLRTGIDVDLLKEMTDRVKQKTINIYQGFVDRKQYGNRTPIPKSELDPVMKDIMDFEALKLKKAEIDAMHAESMEISKGTVPMMKPTDIFGQSTANANPDVRMVQDVIIKNELNKRYIKEQLVYGEDSRLNKIFRKINEQPNAKELREEVANSFIRDTIPKNSLVLEAKNDIRSFLDAFGDANDLRERGFFINKYFPLIVDMENTYKKVKGVWANIDNNNPYNKDTNPKGLHKRYIVADKSILSNDEFLELKAILERKKSWNDLSRYEKNKIRFNILQQEGIYDEWAFLPSDITEKINKKTFNPHLQERKGGEIISYKHDAQEVLKQYLYTMINKEGEIAVKEAVMPIVNKYPRGDMPFSIRWYMEKQIKQAIGTKTMGAKFSSEIVERLNDTIGRDVINPNFPTELAAKLSGQVARGALGADTAIRNIMQSMQTIVNDGPGPFIKGLHSYITGKGVTPESKKMFDLLLKAEEYYEGEPQARTLKGRLEKAETMPRKALAFYDWIGDMALMPMRATEHFNKFVAFQSALSEAAEKGWSFEKGVRFGLKRSMDILPDMIIPDAYYNAFQQTIKSQYGYSKVMRSPLTRGPLAKVSTIFWSYPANTIQFIARGLTDGLNSGDIGKTTRFALYAGFQLSIATAMAQLGLDVGSIFGVGLMPISFFSVPWNMMKGAYLTVAGKTAEDKSSGSDDFLSALGILTVPQFRYGKKVLKTVKNLEDGYKSAGKKEQMTMEMSPYHAIMDLTGFPTIGTKETYELVQQMRDTAYEYNKAKQDIVMRGIKAIDKGKIADVQKLFAEAKDKNVVLTYSELSKYYKLNKTKTYLQSQMEKLPKHLRQPMQKKIAELEEQLMPHKFNKEEITGGRSFWSSPKQSLEVEE